MENFHGECIALECSDHELAERIGKTVASVLSPKNRQNPLVIVGRDGGLSADGAAGAGAGHRFTDPCRQRDRTVRAWPTAGSGACHSFDS